MSSSPTRTRLLRTNAGSEPSVRDSKATILIENPIAVLKNSPDREKANQFLRFLKTPTAQQVFADYGYRPILKNVLEKNRKTFPVRPGQFTIDQLGLGGWEKVQKRFFDPNSSIMARIERQVGGVTGCVAVAPRRVRPRGTRPCPSAS